jgi:hypothetical protein
MSNKIQLHVGYVGVTREGKRVEIVKNYPNSYTYMWVGDNNESYKPSGRFTSSRIDAKDIVGPWINPVNYNDGNWHRWGGDAECPVHENTIVKVSYIDSAGDLEIDDMQAGMWKWGSASVPILAFRVTKEYVEPVEPRDFWIATMNPMLQCDVKIKKPDDMYGYIHVREVIK